MISSAKLLQLKPEMTYEDVVSMLGGKESLSASVRPTYKYLVDKTYQFSIIKSNRLLLCSGQQLLDGVKSGIYNRNTTIDEEKLKLINADMTYREVYCHLGVTVSLSYHSVYNYEFLYIVTEKDGEGPYVDDNYYYLKFDDPDKKISYSGEQIFEAYFNGAPTSPADKLGYITEFNVENKSFKLNADNTSETVYFSDKTDFIILSEPNNNHISYTGPEGFAGQLRSDQLYWISSRDGVVLTVIVKRVR